MKLIIIYDNEVYKKGIGLKSDWGFACLIKTKYDTILFDTGAEGKILLNNMAKLNINPFDIKKIVISHHHGDHTGGLRYLAHFVNDVDLYQFIYEVPSDNMKTTITEMPKEISENVWTIGRIRGIVDEQSLVLKGERGWYVLTGCSHPGVETIMRAAKQIGDIVGIIGGFHSFNNFSVIEDLDFICPCHCTVHKKYLKMIFPNVTFDCGVGKSIDLDVKT